MRTYKLPSGTKTTVFVSNFFTEEEAEELNKETEKIEKMANYLRKQLIKMGISEVGVRVLTNNFIDFTYPENKFKFKFTNDKEQKIDDLWNRWCKKTDERD